MRLEINDITKAVNGKLINPAQNPIYITGVCTDTRKIEIGTLFVPIVGERFDGHDYILTAANNGAVCAFTEKENITDEEINIPLIYVASTRRALMDLAAYYRQMHDVKVVAITGSAGKTTTKDMIYHVLARKFKTKKTMGNFNNDIGLPLSIFQLEPDDEVLVLEMGMNHAGEIHELSLVGKPDIAVITHIGDAHIENFENREGILHAKLEIVDGLSPNGTVILNGDDPLLTGEIAKQKTTSFNVLYPSTPNIIESELIGLQESRCHFNWQGQDIRITVPLPGQHMVMNALLAVAVGVEMGVSSKNISQGFDDLIPPSGRLTVETANDMVIINDVYNANPASMKEAIKVLCRKSNETTEYTRRIAILGDMNELGHVADERHLEIGEFACDEGVDVLIAIGTLSKRICDGFSAKLSENKAKPAQQHCPNKNQELYAAAWHYESIDAFLESWDFLQKSGLVPCPGDIVLVKASRGMEFEKIIKILEEMKTV